MTKFEQLAQLNSGDKVKLINGNKAIFKRLKQKKFIGEMNGDPYDIPVEMFAKVVERIDLDKILIEKEQIYKNLKKGELFYINKDDKAILFKFDSLKNGKIIGKNIINNGRTRIDPALFENKVSGL